MAILSQAEGILSEGAETTWGLVFKKTEASLITGLSVPRPSKLDFNLVLWVMR